MRYPHRRHFSLGNRSPLNYERVQEAAYSQADNPPPKEHALLGEATLFVGAGFSLGGINVLGLPAVYPNSRDRLG